MPAYEAAKLIDRLREVRRDLPTDAAVARALGVAPHTISRWRAGSARPRDLAALRSLLSIHE